jgi:hypothetical protein
MTIDLNWVYEFLPYADPSCIWVEGDGDFDFSNYDISDNEEQPMPVPCFRPSRGKKWLDCLLGGTVTLISDRFRTVLIDNHFTGWKTFDIKLLDRKGNSVGGYYWLKVIGKCGPLDKSRSIVEKRKNNRGDGETEVRIGDYFAENTWDGSDIFRPAKTGCTYVTERVKRAIEYSKITNVQLKRITEIENLY